MAGMGQAEGKQVGIDASGFSGNLQSTDDNAQKVADAVDQLTFGWTEATLQTTTSGYQTIATIALSDPEAMVIDVTGVARRTDATDVGGYVRRALVYRDGGSATKDGSTDSPFTRETDATYNVDITVSGNNALIQVRGDTGHTVEWKVRYKVVRI